MSKHFIRSFLAAGVALAVIAQPATAQAPAGDPDPGVLEIHDTLVDFLDAVGGSETVKLEDFNSDITPPGVNIPRACDNPQHSRMGIPATNFTNRCFYFGELEEGFSARIEDGGVMRVAGTTTFGGDRTTNVFGTFPGLQATLLDFLDGPTAVGLDLYQVDGPPGTIVLEVFAFDGALMGSLEVAPPSVNEAAFAGFTTPAPIRRVRLLTTNPGAAEAIGEMHFGGGVGRLEADPGMLDFGRVGLGDSAQTAVEIRNAGHLDLNLDSLPEPPAPFFLAGDGCSGQPLARDETCTLEIGFEPQHAGDFAAAATVTAGLPFGDELELALAGQAFVPEVSLIPQRVDFGAVAAGTPAGPATVRVANFESAPITVSTIPPAPDPFTLSGGDCPAPPFELAAGESCTLEYDYQPVTAGLSEALIGVESGDLSGTRALHLSGRGLGPALAADPGVVDFGEVAVGDQAELSFDLDNPGSAELNVSAMDPAAAPFERSGGDCPEAPFSLAAGDGCSIAVRFAPDATGDFDQDLEIVSNAPDSPAVVSLAGRGIQGVLEVTPGPLEIGPIMLGDSAAADLTVTNTGDAELEVSTITVPDAPFGLDGGSCDTSGFSLQPGADCTLGIRFDPTEVGLFQGSVTLVSGVGDTVATVTGAGVTSQDAQPLFEPGTAVDFGILVVGEGADAVITVRNAGAAALDISQVEAPSVPFILAGGRGDTACAQPPFSLQPGAACTWTIGFEPQTAGVYDDSLVIQSNADTSPDEVALSGTAVAGGPEDPLVVPTLSLPGLIGLILLVLGAAGWFLLGRKL